MEPSELPALEGSPGEVDWDKFIESESKKTGLSKQQIKQCLCRAGQRAERRMQETMKRWFPKVTFIPE